MVQTVRLPDGRVLEFPDGATQEQIRTAIGRLQVQDRLRNAEGVEFTQDEQRRFFSADDAERRQIMARASGRAAGQQGGGATAALRDALPFGAGTLAGAAGQFVGQQVRALAPGDQEGLAQEGGIGQRFSEALEAERGRTEGLREANPAASIGGAVAGGLATGTGAANLAGRGLAAIAGRGGVVGRLANALRFRQGQTGANIVRGSAAAGTAGAAEGAGAATVQGTDPGTAAAIGGGAGAILGPAGAGVTRAASAVRRVLPGSTPQGFRLLARRVLPRGAPQRDVNRAAADFQTRADQFRQGTGRPASIQELLRPVEADDINVIGRVRPEAGQTLVEGSNAAARARQQTLPRAIIGGRARVGGEDISAIRRDVGDQLFGNIAARPVRLDDRLARVLGEADLRSSIRSASLRTRLSSALEGDASLRVQDIDDIRQALANRFAAGEGRIFGELRDDLVEATSAQVPEFEQAIARSAQLARAEEGFEIGRRASGRTPTTPIRNRLERLNDPATSAAARAGLREGLTSAAEESPQGALSTARRLGEERGVQDRARAILGPQGAERLQRAGQAETRAAESALRTVQGIGTPTQAEQRRLLTEALADVAVLPRAGGAFQSTLATRFVERFGIPRVASIRLAEAIVDPARTDEAVAILQRAGADITALNDIVRGVANSVGISAGRLSARPDSDERGRSGP